MKAEHIPSLATSLIWLQNKLSAVVINEDGKRQLLNLNSLIDSGLPSSNGIDEAVTHCLTTDLQSWCICGPQEYLRIFGLTSVPAKDMRHRLFCFSVGLQTYVIPALALIRALIQPLKSLLADAFQQSFLERVTNLEVLDNESVALTFKFSGSSQLTEKRTENFNSLFGWFASYPSANKMVNSIHKYARAGWIDLDLPKVKAELNVQAIRVGNVNYVYKVRLLQLSPEEPAELLVVGHNNDIRIRHPLDRPRKVALRATLQYSIPSSNDGLMDVTPDEWCAICNHSGIEGIQSPSKTQEQRNLFNAILRKLNSGTPWHEHDFGPLGYKKAAARFHYWHKSGRFSSLVSALQTLRKA